MPYRALTHGRVKRHIKKKPPATVNDNATQQNVSNSSKGLENSGSTVSTRNRADVFSGGLSATPIELTPKVEIRKKDGSLATMRDFKKRNSQGKGKRALANPMPSVGGMSKFAKRAIKRRTNLSTKICCSSGGDRTNINALHFTIDEKEYMIIAVARGETVKQAYDKMNALGYKYDAMSDNDYTYFKTQSLIDSDVTPKISNFIEKDVRLYGDKETVGSILIGAGGEMVTKEFGYMGFTPTNPTVRDNMYYPSWRIDIDWLENFSDFQFSRNPAQLPSQWLNTDTPLKGTKLYLLGSK